MPQLSEKLHQGVPSSNPALYLGHEVCKSTTALGLRAALHLERVKSRSTGKERDTESGNDYFGARYYASSMGRFMSPDWSAKEDPVPYAQLDDPQSLNLYSYVRNNPLARTDPDGHCCEEVWTGLTVGAEVVGGAIVGATEGLVVLGGAALGAAGYSVSQGNSPYLTNGYPTSFNLNPTSLNASSASPSGQSGPRNTMGGGQLGEPDGPKRGSTGGRGSGRRATKAERKEALAENNGKCVFCGADANEAEHSIPVSRGGDNTTGSDGNLQPACTGCNRGPGGKHTATSEEYIQRKQTESQADAIRKKTQWN